MPPVAETDLHAMAVQSYRAGRLTIAQLLPEERAVLLPLLLLNTTINTALPAEPGPETVIVTRKVTSDDARRLTHEARDGHGLQSFVGHPDSARVLCTALGLEIASSRGQAAQAVGQQALCMKIRGRLPEGVVLTAGQVEEIGYDWYLMTRTA